MTAVGCRPDAAPGESFMVLPARFTASHRSISDSGLDATFGTQAALIGWAGTIT